MEKQLADKKVLVMVANGVDESVMSEVQRELLKTGATVKTAGMEPGLVNSWNGTVWGLYFPVDQQISQTLGADFDCLVVPSGARGIQKLATSAHSERILSSFATSGKPVAFIGDAIELVGRVRLTGIETQPNIASCASVAEALRHLAGAPALEKVAA